MHVVRVSRVFAAASTGLLLVVALVDGVSSASADAATVPAPAWALHVAAQPTSFQPSQSFDEYQIRLANVGGVASHGPVTLTDTLPAGVTTSAQAGNGGAGEGGEWECTPGAGQHVVTCGLPGPVAALGQAPPLVVPVAVAEGTTSPLVDDARVAGGGAPEAAASAQTLLAASPPFGLSAFASPTLGLDGMPALQAGAHPNALALSAALNTVVRETPEGLIGPTSIRDLRDIVLDLPLGLVGSALAAPTCTLTQLASKGEAGELGGSGCPADTAIGHIRTEPEGGVGLNGTLYNVVPERGVAVEFGYADATGGTHVLYGSLAPSPAGYVLRLTAREVPQIALTGLSVTISGDPAARDGSSLAPVPTFTNPADCAGQPLQTVIHVDSWQAPGSYGADGTPDFADPNWASASFESPPVTGCGVLAGLFAPSITAIPSSGQTDTPTGLDVNVALPQQGGVEALATPPLRDAVVTLPAGLGINPSAANGLEGCSLAELGISPAGVPDAAAPQCPDAAKLGSAELETPALPAEACREAKPLRECPAAAERERTPLQGALYLARPHENPFASLLAIYVVIDDPRTGVIVKLPADVSADPLSGRLTLALKDAPQFPVSDLRLHFFAGSTALLATPASCGTYTVSSALTPWSAPESGPAARPSSSFEVTQGAGGGGCSSPFAPAFTAGSTNAQAGRFTPLSVTFSREDGEQELGGVSVTPPPGLSGVLSGVALCPEPQASSGTCGPDSLIGEATMAVGAGPSPYWVHGGKVYLTGPYKGGPFGLSIVVPTTAGPFTLTGNGGPGREIVRGSIRVDPSTAQLTVVSDPLPTIIAGVALKVRTVNITVTRPGFIFNPTNCSQLNVTGALTSTQGTNAGVSSPFRAANCAALRFTPKFSVSTSAHPSKAQSASLTVRLAEPAGSMGTQANVSRVKLELPRQLPTPLKTLQKACIDRVFNANPALCPPESVVGHAVVHTPLLPVPLSGPAYFVSHGREEFPNLTMVLQGYGVTVVVVGSTLIRKGITSTTFKTVPDVPFENFELVFPQGNYSALGANLPTSANGSFCGQKLIMPTEFIAQNGMQLHQNTQIAVTGCSLTILSHKLKGRKLTLRVFVPSAGKLKASGEGLSSTSKTAKGARTLTLSVHAKKRGKLKTNLKLTFTRSNGVRQAKALSLRI
jgi:hypothetical protein